MLHILQRLKAWIALAFSFRNQPLLLSCHVTLYVVILAGTYQVPEGKSKCLYMAATHFVSV
jgi:hypothetical protein